MSSIAAVILAGGASRRMGRPKALLSWNGSTLISRAIGAARGARLRPIVVVGADSQRIVSALSPGLADVVKNSQWQEGIASSIRAGIRWLANLEPGPAAAMILAVDQPAVGPDILQEIVRRFVSTGEPLVASHYAGVLGVPVLFSRALFPELLCLSGDTGARAVISEHCDSAGSVEFPGGEFDVDTPEEWRTLREGAQKAFSTIRISHS